MNNNNNQLPKLPPYPLSAKKSAVPKRGGPQRLVSIRKHPALTLGGVPKKSFSPKVSGVPKLPKSSAPSTANTNKKFHSVASIANAFNPQIPIATKIKPEPQKPKEKTNDKKKASASKPKGSKRSGGLMPAATGTSGKASRDAVAASKARKFDADGNGIKDPSLKLAQILKPHNENHPIAFPWDDPRLHLAKQKKTKNKNVTENQEEFFEQKATGVFQNLDGTPMEENELIFLQLPSCLPTSASNQTIPQTTDKLSDEFAFYTNNFANTMITPDLEGRVGKMIIYKSGKVKWKIGEAVFDVVPSSQSQFLQEVYLVKQIDDITNTVPRHAYRLGDLSQKLMVSPDLEHIFGQQDLISTVHVQGGENT